MEKESSSPSSVWMVTVLIVASRMVPVMVCSSAGSAVAGIDTGIGCGAGLAAACFIGLVGAGLIAAGLVACIGAGLNAAGLVSRVGAVSSVASVVSSVESEPDSSSVVTVSTLLWFVSELLSVSEEQAAKENSISDASNTAKRFFIEKTPFCMIRYGPPHRTYTIQQKDEWAVYNVVIYWFYKY